MSNITEAITYLEKARELLLAELEARKGVFLDNGLPISSHASSYFIKQAMTDTASAVNYLRMIRQPELINIKSKAMSNLRLPLERKWFDMTDAGIKSEDYRDITPYWCGRLVLIAGKAMPKSWWEKQFQHNSIDDIVEWINANLYLKNFSFKNFDTTTITLGYPAATDTKRIRKYENGGIEIRTGNRAWGAEPGKLYFVIKHGAEICEIV